MKAWYIDIPQVGDPRYPDVGELERLLEARGIRGIDRDRLGAFCAGLPAAGRRPVAATLVEGRAPVPGRDARLVFEMDPETPPGAAREDGSTGARERPLFSRVKAGDRLGRKSPAVPGIPGMTLYGQRLETTDGVDVPAEPGQGVRVEPDGADLVFYASRDGVVSRMGDCVQVSSMLHLEGDVDAATGHVDTDQDVYVAGSVRSGFRVDAGGHVTVAGGVESGAVIRAKGNLSVSGGIVGRNTLVVVLGDLRAHFIQNGRAVVRGDVWIGSYLHYASVQCGGVLTVNPGTGNRGGSVIGGTLSATRGIQVVQAGSPLAVKTVLALRTNPETRARMARLADALKADEDTIAKMMRTLGVRQLNAASVRLAMERAAAPQRQLLVKVLEQLGILIKRRDESLRERRRLEAGEREKIEGGSIRISSFVHDNVEIQIEPERIAAPEGRGPVAFRWSGNGILADRAAG
jgi:uncharacterized protein (DUF342 family)